MRVIVRKNETIDSALDRFSKKISKSGLLKNVRDKKYHKKKSEIRNEKKRKRAYSQRKLKK